MNNATAAVIRWIDSENNVSSLDFNAIAVCLGLAAITVSQIMGELIAAGLVRRDESRMVHNLATYRLTAAGLDAVDELREAARAKYAAKKAAAERAEREAAAEFDARWSGDFCPLCALMGRDRCECEK